MTNCVKQGTAGVTRFILITMVGRFFTKKGQSDPLPAHPAGGPPTGGLGPWPDMEAARGLTAPICGVPERGPGAELERSLVSGFKAWSTRATLRLLYASMSCPSQSTAMLSKSGGH